MGKATETTQPAKRRLVWVAPHRTSFTLVEMMAVTILLAVLVGTAVVRLPGIAQRERVESALANIAQFDALARIQAVASGRPRMLVFPQDESKVGILEPTVEDRRLKWKTVARLRYDDHVRIIRVLLEGETQEEGSAEISDNVGGDEGALADTKTVDRILIRGDGQSATYAVVCRVGEGVRGVLIIDGRTGLSRLLDVDAENRFDWSLVNESGVLCD